MNSRKVRSASFVLFVAILLGPVMVASAATKATSPPVSNPSALKISPVRSDVTVQPGASLKVPVYVTNVTSSAIMLQPIENDFVAGDESGKPSILLDANSYAPTHSLKRFMVPLQAITVAPNATQQVDVTITVPKTAQAGGYFGAVRFAPASSDGTKSVNIGSSVTSLILMTVPGDTVEQLTLTNFDVQQNGGTATNFRTPKDLALLVRFQNKGNVQLAPFGKVYVQKGKKTVYSANFNDSDPKAEILPDSARRWVLPVKGFGKFGKYTVSATFGYGTKGQNIEITKTVWIFPTAYILGIVGGFVALVVIVGGAFMFLRSYKRRILRSSRRRY